MQIEEAKKLLNRIDIKFFLNGTIEQSNYIVDKADEVNKAIETVLNELEKKEAEIDKLRNTNKDLLKKLRNRVKEVKKLTRYSLYKKEFARLNKQLEKKDKVIDLLADDLRYYEGMQQDQLFCIDTCEGKMCDEEHCKERIKEYFYKKVE